MDSTEVPPRHVRYQVRTVSTCLQNGQIIYKYDVVLKTRSRCSVETYGRIEPVFGMQTSFHLHTVIRKFR